MPRVSVIAKNYAKTLFVVAKKNNALEKVSEELERFKQNFSNSFAQELKSPVITKVDLAKIIGEVTAKFKLGALTSNLFSTIVRNRRLNLFPEVYEEFFRLIKTYQNVLEVEVYSAASLGLEEIKKLIEKKYPDKTIILRHKIVPEIAGGLQIKIGSLIIDSSLKSQIEQIRKKCLAAIG
jgi:F-type H+-transporting ATPase subunit delta